MAADPAEIDRRKQAALVAIKSVYGTEADECGATLFVSHHLEEVEDSFWEKHLKSASPKPQQVLELLVFKDHWGEDDDEIEVFDFTLPDEITNYVISVRFDEDGQVEDVSMES